MMYIAIESSISPTAAKPNHRKVSIALSSRKIIVLEPLTSRFPRELFRHAPWSRRKKEIRIL
jgi:hypothetical protein